MVINQLISLFIIFINNIINGTYIALCVQGVLQGHSTININNCQLKINKLTEISNTTPAQSQAYTFEEIFYLAKDEFKTQFLHQLLIQNEQLKNEFIQYINRRAKEHR